MQHKHTRSAAPSYSWAFACYGCHFLSEAAAWDCSICTCQHYILAKVSDWQGRCKSWKPIKQYVMWLRDCACCLPCTNIFRDWMIFAHCCELFGPSMAWGKLQQGMTISGQGGNMCQFCWWLELASMLHQEPLC